MQHKRRFYKNGIVIGVLMFFVALIITKVNFDAGAILGVSGMIVFFFSLIRMLARRIFGKKKVQPTLEVEQPVELIIPTQTPEILETPTSKEAPAEATPAPSIPEVEQLQPEAVCVELPEPAESEPALSEPVILESEAQAIQPMSAPAPVEMSVSAPVEMSASAPVEKMSPLEESIVPELWAEDDEPAVCFEKLTVDEFVQEAGKVGYVAFDFETTGFSSENDRIIEIGAIKMDVNGNEIGSYSSLVNPERHISSKIAAITGIADDMVRAAPTIDRVLPDFLRFIHGYPLIAWNASFDKGFLEKNVCRCGLGCDAEYTDALAWARKVYDLPSYKQGLVADHIGYVPQNAHRALADCETLVAIVNDLRKNTTLEERVEVPHPTYNPQPDVTNPDIILRGVSGLSENDEEVARYFISLILGKYTDAQLSIMQNNSYITLCVPGAYILRFHCGPHKKWVAIDSYRVELNREDELFAAQKNKDQRFWRSDFDKIESIHLYDEYVLNTYIKAITEQV